MTEPRESRVSSETIETVLEFLLKAWLAVIAIAIVGGIGIWIAGFLPFPEWVPVWVRQIIVTGVFVNTYLLWRWNGGKVHLREGDLVVRWPGASDENPEEGSDEK